MFKSDYFRVKKTDISSALWGSLTCTQDNFCGIKKTFLKVC